MKVNLNLNTNVPYFKADVEWDVKRLFKTWRENIAESGDQTSLDKFDRLRRDIDDTNDDATVSLDDTFNTIEIETDSSYFPPCFVKPGDYESVDNAKPTLPTDKILKKMKKILKKLEDLDDY